MYFKEGDQWNDIVCDFVSLVIHGVSGCMKDRISMGVFKDKELIAGVLYQNYYPNSGVMELSVASTSNGWVTKRVVRDMLHLPFGIFNSRMVMAKTAEGNMPVRRVLERIGLESVYVPKLRSESEGEFIYTLSADKWRSMPISKV